jgi:transposase
MAFELSWLFSGRRKTGRRRDARTVGTRRCSVQLIESILRTQRRSDGRGRAWQDTRAVLNGILWNLGTGAQWREVPRKYPSYQTCHRRFQQWEREGKLELILHVLAEQLQARGKLQLAVAFVDASFTGAKSVWCVSVACKSCSGNYVAAYS